LRLDPKLRASNIASESTNIPHIDHDNVVDPQTLTHLEDSIMEATLCQVTEANVAEIAAEQTSETSINTLTSAEMSFAGGGLMAVMFA